MKDEGRQKTGVRRKKDEERSKKISVYYTDFRLLSPDSRLLSSFILHPSSFFHFLALASIVTGRFSSTAECGRGITWTLISSPTRRAAAAPASVAAFTAATSPRTIAVTKPAPIFSYPTSVTFAALTIASAASIIATSPFVSTIPRASI